MNPSRDALGYQQLGTLTAAIGLTIPAGTETVLLQGESQNIRYRDDGTDPTASSGMVLAAGTLYEMTVGQIARMKFIEATSAAKLNVSYYGRKAVNPT